MKTKFITPLALTALLVSGMVVGCHKKGGDDSVSPPADDSYDVNSRGVPRFVGTDFIELDKIQRISKFRSSVGHDYWDTFEHCRSMKHYFEPKGSVDWSTVSVYAPVKGTVFRLDQEWAGTQVHIKSDVQPAFYFIIFHINLATPLNIGDRVEAGQRLGNHIGTQTMSDIAVGVSTPGGWKLVSYFDTMTDPLFSQYQLRGLASRSDAIISKAARDADTLMCSGDTFLNGGTLENWVTLN